MPTLSKSFLIELNTSVNLLWKRYEGKFMLKKKRKLPTKGFNSCKNPNNFTTLFIVIDRKIQLRSLALCLHLGHSGSKAVLTGGRDICFPKLQTHLSLHTSLLSLWQFFTSGLQLLPQKRHILLSNACSGHEKPKKKKLLHGHESALQALKKIVWTDMHIAHREHAPACTESTSAHTHQGLLLYLSLREVFSVACRLAVSYTQEGWRGTA